MSEIDRLRKRVAWLEDEIERLRQERERRPPSQDWSLSALRANAVILDVAPTPALCRVMWAEPWCLGVHDCGLAAGHAGPCRCGACGAPMRPGVEVPHV